MQPPSERLPGALRTHQREVASAAALSSSGIIAALLDEFTEPGMLVTVVSRRRAAAAVAAALPRGAQLCICCPALPYPTQKSVPDCLSTLSQWELVEGMDLLDYLNSRGGVLAEAEAAPLFAQLAHGIRLIHEAGLVHRGVC